MSSIHSRNPFCFYSFLLVGLAFTGWGHLSSAQAFDTGVRVGSVVTDNPGKFPPEDVFFSVDARGEALGIYTSKNPGKLTTIGQLKTKGGRTIKREWGVSIVTIEANAGFSASDGGQLVLRVRGDLSGSTWHSVKLIARNTGGGRWALYSENGFVVTKLSIALKGKSFPQRVTAEP